VTPEGTCDPRFEAVRAAFDDNFDRHGEIGAAVCVAVEGHVVVDVWGGRIRGEPSARPWQHDTLVNVYSVGKGLTALVVGGLVSRGMLDLDERVTHGWPAFGCEGKDDVTVRDLLTHQAGLPAIRRPLPPRAMFDWATMTEALAAERPWWMPRDGHGYHVNTFGYLVGEVVRRATGATVGTHLRTEVAEPLGADVHIGLTSRHHGRVADFQWAGPHHVDGPPPDLDGDELMRYNAYLNPAGVSGAGVVNTPAWREAEIPSTNAHASARGVARVYEALAAGGRVDGVEVVDAEVLRELTTEQVDGPDRVLGRPSRFGVGFQLTQPERPFGPNPGAFGHFGAGGSLGFGDPTAGVAFGYVMNNPSPGWQNPRNRSLVDALYASLAS
jgi:CubicO group peptidase (beta-lactamase class C family)